MEFELIAKTFMGLEPVLAQELTQLGANNVQIGRRMVSFSGDKEMMYLANFQLHTAIRILKPIRHFKANSADDVYNEVQTIDWAEYIPEGKTFSVDSVVYSEEFRNSRFVTYKVKDAIVDQFRQKTGTRPNISITNPDIRLHIHIAEDKATLCLDSSGESLHRRGYRQESVEAPLNEVLAAGMILMTGWHGECDLIDPMDGSGTIAIEAGLNRASVRVTLISLPKSQETSLGLPLPPRASAELAVCSTVETFRVSRKRTGAPLEPSALIL